MITLTTLAAEKVQEARTAQEMTDKHFLRVGIAGGGCSGLRYALAFDDVFEPELDTQFNSEGVRIVTRKKFAEFLDGMEIDFKATPMGVGFFPENPNFPPGGCAGCAGG